MRVVLAAGVLAAFCATHPSAEDAPARRVVLISFDGAADWMIDRWIEQGKAPAFAQMVKDGASADAALSTVPSLTSVAHASIWTGAPPPASGISGNAVLLDPPGEHTIEETASGFESTARRTEAIWEAAGRAGKRALVLQASAAYPFPTTSTPNVLLFDIYGKRIAPAELVTGSLTAGRYTLETPGGPATLTAVEGGTLDVAIGTQTFSVAAQPDKAWTPPIHTTAGTNHGTFTIGLLDYSPLTGAFMLVRGEVLQVASSDPSQVEPFTAAAGTLVDEGAFVGWYRRDRLGPTLASSGTGRAEERLVALTVAAHDYFLDALGFAASRPWDLLVCYSPAFDEFAHAMGGLVDPDSSGSSPALADRAWPHLERAFAGTVDRFLSDVRSRFPDAVVVVTSDHGMEGTGRVLYPNVILRQAGLLGLGAQGRIDPALTKAVVLDRRAGAVTINTVERKGGVVTEADRPRLKREIAAALLAARDPDTGGPVVRAVLDADTDGQALGFSREGGVDLVLDPAVDYAIDAAAGGERVAGPSPFPVAEGRHGGLATRRRLHAIFYAAGPGIAPGRRLPLVRLIDVAPTVARLLGIPPPAQSAGMALPIESE